MLAKEGRAARKKGAKALHQIEPLLGSVHVQFRRCGAPNCRCARGEPHPYFARFWREAGRLRKQYIKRADVETVKARCEAHRQAVARQRQAKAEVRARWGSDRELFRFLRAFLRGSDNE